jgi:TatD DNase family protein
MIDTHTHLNFEVFKDNWKDVVEAAVEAGVEKMIVVGTDLESSKRAVEMVQEHPALYAAVGIHPHHSRALLGSLNVKTKMSKLINELNELAKQPKVVAIGEVGLDRHKYNNSKYQMTNDKNGDELIWELQKALFIAQVRLAVKMDMPLIIHSREVGDKVLEIMLNIKCQISKPIRGVFHCYEGSKKYAMRILEAGFYISFTGNMTYSDDRLEAARTIPLDKLLLETDSPYILPEPLRSKNSPPLSRKPTSPKLREVIWATEGCGNPSVVKRELPSRLVNTPENVRIIASSHAESRRINLKEVIEQTSINTRQLFRI